MSHRDVLVSTTLIDGGSTGARTWETNPQDRSNRVTQQVLVQAQGDTVSEPGP